MKTSLEDGSSFALSQQTDYPWDETVSITIDEASGQTIGLMLRIPGWASDAKLTINGEASGLTLTAGSYIEIKRSWQTGDTLVLTLPMKPRLMKAHPKAEEIRNHVAVMRGPLVYCLEGVDLPDDVSILEVYAPDDMQLIDSMQEDLLGGVTVIKGKARRIIEAVAAPALYLEAGNEQEEELDITLVPYYAWNNRGISEMTVWLPRRY